jgi:hypothetical protein
MTNTLKIQTDSTTGESAKWHLPLALVVIAALTVAVYWPVLQNGFIDFDDDVYVTINTAVRQGLTLKGFIWSFTTFHAANWHPLTWLSHMLDIELFNLNPVGHHATSLLLHTINSLLLCTIFYRLTGFIGRSMFVALLFAIHPLHVESVAWVAERKDVLSTLFWLLALWAYCGYAHKPSLKRYLPVAVFFALGLMAKQMLVTLPLTLLLIDFWPLKRIALHQARSNSDRSSIKQLLIEKIPLLVMSAAASLVTIRAQESAGAVVHGDSQSVLLCAGNAFISYVKYMLLMLWPTDLALFYPFEPSAVTTTKVAEAIVLLAVITALAAMQWIKRPYLLFGWFWYLITLLPVIGFIRIGGQALADRYTYIPLIGLFVLIVWGGTELAGSWPKGKQLVAGVAVIITVILSVQTTTQIRYWQNSYILFDHALAVVERNWMAHNNMGILLSQHNRNDEAIFHFQESVRLNPKGIAGYRNLGNSLQMAGKNPEAIEAFRQSVWINPNDAESHFRLGYAYLLGGNSDLAYQEYRLLLRLDEANARTLLDSIRTLGRH